MRVCYFGTYREEYSRNRIMIEGLRRAGVEVVECHQSLWQGIEDRVKAASGGWLKPAFWKRLATTYWRLLQQYRQIGDYDILVVGYPGQMDVFLGRILSWISRKPLVWDVFMSIYLITLERKLDRRSPFSAQLIRRLEWLACRVPDRLILDTQEYVAWFQETHRVAPERFRLVPTGADDRIFHPIEIKGPPDSIFRVIFYGTFVAGHRVPYIIETARQLQHEPDLCIELIGDGPEKAAAEALAQSYALANVKFYGWLEREALTERLARADICLGSFGYTLQLMMTVQNKIYEGMALGKPVITRDAPATRAVFKHGEEILFCDPDDPESLGRAILQLKHDPELRARMGAQGHQRFLQGYTLARIGQTYRRHLNEVIANAR